MITASHNVWYDNGVKVVVNGEIPSAEEEGEIKGYMKGGLKGDNDKKGANKAVMTIGWDNRFSSLYLVGVVTLGWGGRVRHIGVCSTPALHWCAMLDRVGRRGVGEWAEMVGRGYMDIMDEVKPFRKTRNVNIGEGGWGEATARIITPQSYTTHNISDRRYRPSSRLRNGCRFRDLPPPPASPPKPAPKPVERFPPNHRPQYQAQPQLRF